MVPSESQVEEVIQPCDILSEYDASSHSKKSKAKRKQTPLNMNNNPFRI